MDRCLTISEVTLAATTGRLIRVVYPAASHASSGTVDIVAAGNLVWVADGGNAPTDNPVTILNAATDVPIRTFNTTYGAYYPPNSLAVGGKDLWVTVNGSPNVGNGGVTEFDRSTGAVVRAIGSAADGFNLPEVIAVAGNHVWIANNQANSLIELSAATGDLEKIIT